MKKFQKGPTKKIEIKAPRPTTTTNQQFIDQTWNLLHEAILQIYDKQSSNLSYEELHRSAYKLVLNRHSEILYKNINDCIKNRIQFIYLNFILQKQFNDLNLFLKNICNIWDDYKRETSVISSVLMYLNTNYIQKQLQQPSTGTISFYGNNNNTTINSNNNSIKDENNLPLLTIYELGIILFKIIIFYKNNIGTQIRKYILELIEKERKGETIDRLLIKNIINIFIEMNCYEDLFENYFLENSKNYYENYCNELILNYSIIDYIKKCDFIFKEENMRINYYLHFNTKNKLDSILRNILITKNLQFIFENDKTGFIYMIKENCYNSLQKLYFLFLNEELHLNYLLNFYKKIILEYGNNYILQNNEENTLQPIPFIEGLLELQYKFNKITKLSFENNKKFITLQNECFLQFCDGTKFKRLAEYLSIYLDHLLKSNLSFNNVYNNNDYNNNSIENQLNDIMILFHYLKDKDIFENYYKIHLSKRLLIFKAYDLDLEKSFIFKLKKECGYSFTSKIEGMFNDIKHSIQLNENFKNYLNNNNTTTTILSNIDNNKKESKMIDFYVNVLTQSFWPAYTISNANLPFELNNCCEVFLNYYNQIHSGRKITWQKGLGDGILIYRNDNKYELVVTTYQIIILMLFNDKDFYTFKELKEFTLIPEKELKRNLIVLCSSKFLIKEPKTKSLEDDHTFNLNKLFKSSNYRIKLGLQLTKENDEEVKETETKIENERKPVIEAAIVRIMKTRKRLHHNQLLEEVVKQLQSRFTPNPQEIKRRIENLIEREFLSREKEDHKVLNYVA
ncbi:hypothetical protein ABK040_013659 [Willaertia magna]